MGLFSWFKKRHAADAKRDAEREAKINKIHEQIFKDADEAEKITKEVNKLLEGKEGDIAHQIYLATRGGNGK